MSNFSQIDFKQSVEPDLFQFTYEFISRRSIFLDSAYAKADITIFQTIAKIQLAIGPILLEQKKAVDSRHPLLVQQIIADPTLIVYSIYPAQIQIKKKMEAKERSHFVQWDHKVRWVKFPKVTETEYTTNISPGLSLTKEQQTMLLKAIRQKIGSQFPNLQADTLCSAGMSIRFQAGN